MSNSVFAEAFFEKVNMKSNKLIGSAFSDSILKYTSFCNCLCSYSVFNKSVLDSVSMRDSEFIDAELTNCKFKDINMSNCRFSGTSFFRTPLIGMDFTDCVLEAIRVSDDFSELKGVKVNELQALELSALLKIIIE